MLLYSADFLAKFHSPGAELVDCSISLNQFHSPDNRLVQLNSFQEEVIQVGSQSYAYKVQESGI